MMRALMPVLLMANAALAGASTVARGQPPAPTTTTQATLVAAAPAKAGAGEVVTLSGVLPDSGGLLYYLHVERPAGGDAIDSIRVHSADGRTATFTVPDGLPLGRYRLRLARSRPANDAVGFAGLDVVTRRPVRIDAVSTEVFYPKDAAQRDTLYVRGSGFSTNRGDNVLLMGDDRGRPLCDTPSSSDCLPGDVLEQGRALRFILRPKAYAGTVMLRVRVGDSLSQGDPRPLIYSRVGRWTPVGIAVLFLTLMGVLVYWLTKSKTWTSEQSTAPTPGRPESPEGATQRVRRGARTFFHAALIDETTNTYSLSKFQLLLWTTAAIGGYVYLSAARSLVQGTFTLADVPENLPGIIAITSSTTLLTLGTNAARGGKGAGDEDPSLADFFTTGGVIAPERLQFFLWTIIGVGAFLVFTVMIDPGRIEALPAVPERFLYLMGLSSFGYVGGKLARKPGPVIQDASLALGGTNALVFDIHGMHLSPDASFRITAGKDDKEDIEIKRDMIANNGRAETMLTDADDPGFAKALRLTVDRPPAEWTTPGWRATARSFTLSNPDGQKAVVKVKGSTAPQTPDDPPPAPSPAPSIDATASAPDTTGTAPPVNTVTEAPAETSGDAPGGASDGETTAEPGREPA